MITVITPTIRYDTELFKITRDAMARQTYKDVQWLVATGDPKDGFTLPSDYNKALAKAEGEIIVSLQDCIDIPADALEAISKLDHEKKAYTYPVGKVKTWDNLVKPEEAVWDWRQSSEKARGTASLPSPAHWEIDFASAPRSLFFDVGGFDEDFNNGWSWENVEIAYRAHLLGYDFRVSRVTQGVAYDHDEHIEHPFRGKRENNDARATQSRVMADGGRIKLDFL